MIVRSGYADIAASRFKMRKHWIMWWENIYIFYTHVRDAYANGILKEKKRKRKDDPKL